MARPPGRKQKGPFVDDCLPGKYAWCRCGASAQYPYCDGTHRMFAADSGKLDDSRGAANASDTDPAATPVHPTPLKVVFDKPCTVVWCACGTTKNPPFCDGSHCRS